MFVFFVMVGSIFNMHIYYFKRHGAEVVEKGPSSSSKKSAVFKGTGYRLGQSEADTEGMIAAS